MEGGCGCGGWVNLEDGKAIRCITIREVGLSNAPMSMGSQISGIGYALGAGCCSAWQAMNRVVDGFVRLLGSYGDSTRGRREYVLKVDCFGSGRAGHLYGVDTYL